MKYNDIDKSVSHLTLKEPNHNLRDKVLLKARTVWIEKQPVPLFTFRLIRNYAYALAMLLLISIISSKIDSSLTDKLIDRKTTLVTRTENNRDMKNLYSDLGIDYKNYKLLAGMVSTEEDKNKSNIFDQRKQLMKELNLINGGLS